MNLSRTSSHAAAIIVGTLLAAGPSPGASAPEEWDSRLDDLGVYLEPCNAPAGIWYWRLVSARFEDEMEAAGTHHVFFRTLGEAGRPIEGQKVWLAWPTGAPSDKASAETKGSLDGFWGNLALYGGWCPFWPEGGHGPYGAYADGEGDAVWGMGLPCNRHVSFRLIWRWTLSSGGDGGGESLVRNGDFSGGLEGWSTWIERGSLHPAVTGGKLHLQGDGFNGGVWQQFRTPGAGAVIPVSGFWASQPALAERQWAEVLAINGPRLPTDGEDITGSRPDEILIFKNDTWASPGGWSGEMAETAPVAATGAFTAAADVATIVHKAGNVGGGTTGALFDDIRVGDGEPPAEPIFTRGDANDDGAVDISDAVAVLLHLFVEPRGITCQDAADSNDDGTVDISDPVAVLGFLFLGGAPLEPVCGPDPTGDGLGCLSYTGCP